MRFVTYDVAIEVARGMQQPLAAMRRYRASLADQCRRALESVVLNIAEGGGRYGDDRTRFFAIALGSLREVDAAIELACMGGAFDEPPMAAARDRLGGLLWPQAHK